jgi:hypothetical protein
MYVVITELNLLKSKQSVTLNSSIVQCFPNLVEHETLLTYQNINVMISKLGIKITQISVA